MGHQRIKENDIKLSLNAFFFVCLFGLVGLVCWVGWVGAHQRKYGHIVPNTTILAKIKRV